MLPIPFLVVPQSYVLGRRVLLDQSFRESSEVERASTRAIFLAYNSGEIDVRRLTSMLYFYNRIPFSQKWQRRFPSDESLCRFLGFRKDDSWPGSRAFHLSKRLAPENVPVSRDVWGQWSILRRGLSSTGRLTTYKIYVSPHLDELPNVIRHIGETAVKFGAAATKIGTEVRTLLRPDKLLVYFRDLKKALSYGRYLDANINCNRTQAVPFSYPIGLSGLISIGFDPPTSVRWTYGLEGGSWRLLVSTCIAETIVSVRESRPADVLQEIHRQLRAKNIDPLRWKPLNGAWNA
jgi:hypothetical protein